MNPAYPKSLQRERLIGPIIGIMILSTFFYDKNTVGLSLTTPHLLIKLFTALSIAILPQLQVFSSTRSNFWIVVSVLFFHATYNGLLIDCAYHNGINQAMAAAILVGRGVKKKEMAITVIGGIFISWLILKFGPGFSYIETFKSSPMGDYLHGTIIYGVASYAIYHFTLEPIYKKENEIKRLAGIGLKSRYLIHEVKNLGESGEENENLKDILEIINIVTSQHVLKEEIKVDNEIQILADGFKKRCEIKGITLELDLAPTKMILDIRSFKIIIQNLLLNAIEYLEESQFKEKIIYIQTKNKSLKITNTYDGPLDIESFFELNKTTKTSLKNQGIGLNIVEELCKINNLSLKLKSIKKRFEVSFSQ